MEPGPGGPLAQPSGKLNHRLQGPVLIAARRPVHDLARRPFSRRSRLAPPGQIYAVRALQNTAPDLFSFLVDLHAGCFRDLKLTVSMWVAPGAQSFRFYPLPVLAVRALGRKVGPWRSRIQRDFSPTLSGIAARRLGL